MFAVIICWTPSLMEIKIGGGSRFHNKNILYTFLKANKNPNTNPHEIAMSSSYHLFVSPSVSRSILPV